MKISNALIGIFAVVALCSCNVQKRIVYLQDAKNQDMVTMVENGQIRIKPLDKLKIIVSSKDPELAAPFNMTSTYNSLAADTRITSSVNGEQSLQVRTVAPDGTLDMPIIGMIQCEGRTRSELAKEIADKIREGGYISDPSVNVQFADMKITVMGEVSRPGQYDIIHDEITVLDALALAGDLTIYGVRSEVAVIREVDGKSVVTYLDLRSKDMFSSPCYYLQQNDIVYVKPNRYKAATAEINQNRTFWLSLVSSLVSVSTLIISIISLTK